MTRNTLLASTLVGVLAITGCMSLEERLASNDPTIKRNAEYELVANSRRTGTEADRIAAIKRVTNADLLMEIALTAHPEQKKKEGTVSSTIPDGMAALEKLTDQKSLSKLATKADAEEIRLAAIGQITDQDILLRIYNESYDITTKNHTLPRLNGASLATIAYTTNLIPYWKQIADQRVLAKIYRDGHQTLSDIDKHELLDKLTDEKIIKEMVTRPSYAEYEKWNRRQVELHQQIARAEYEVKSRMESAKYSEQKSEFSSAKMKRAEANKLKADIIKMKHELTTSCNFLYVGEPGYRLADAPFNVSKHSALVKKLSEDQIVKIAQESLKSYLSEANTYGIDYAWRRGELKKATELASYLKDEKNTLAILTKILTNHIGGGKNVAKLIDGFPKVSDVAYGELICLDDIGWKWKYLLKKITPAVAYGILTQGKAKSEELETELAKMLPAEKIDMKVYEAVRYDAAKKVVMSKMSAAMKKSIAEKNVKAFAVVEEKAKVAAKDTFELHGFYLGMDWEDMKTVLAHHFPDLEIKEMRDGKSNDDDSIIDLPNQRSPFCYASAKDKKVYKFNFGKKMLKKWYPYDVQTFREWAHAYSRENKIDMKYKEIEKEATVTEPMDWSRSYRVWFHQESYQYKHNTKEYRLTYFGEEKDFTVHGGLGGALIKEAAAPQFRYVRGDPGSLRASIEND